eukprot:3325754-Rhodomonas_salina.1
MQREMQTAKVSHSESFSNIPNLGVADSNEAVFLKVGGGVRFTLPVRILRKEVHIYNSELKVELIKSKSHRLNLSSTRGYQDQFEGIKLPLHFPLCIC